MKNKPKHLKISPSTNPHTNRLFFTLPHIHTKPQKPRTQSCTHRTAGFSTNGSSNIPTHAHQRTASPPHTHRSLWVYRFAVTQSDVMCNLAACLFDETLVWWSRGSLPDRTHSWSGQLSPADIVLFFSSKKSIVNFSEPQPVWEVRQVDDQVGGYRCWGLSWNQTW